MHDRNATGLFLHTHIVLSIFAQWCYFSYTLHVNSVSLLVHKGWWATHKPPAKQSISRRSICPARRTHIASLLNIFAFVINSSYQVYIYIGHLRHTCVLIIYGALHTTYIMHSMVSNPKHISSRHICVNHDAPNQRPSGFLSASGDRSAIYNAIWTITTTAQKKLYNYNKVQTRSALVIEFFCLAVVSALLII